MGEADLVVATGPAQLRAEAIGDPEGGTDVAEEFGDHVLAAARTDDEAAILTVMEGPQPPVPLAEPARWSHPTAALPASRRVRIRLLCRAKAGRLSASMATRAPSLIASPNRSDISRASRSNEIAWTNRR